MRSAERWRVAAAALLLALLAACGGNSTETRIIGGGVDGGATGPEVAVTQPDGPNTTEIVVDSGPPSTFVLGVANLPYVTLTVCAPGSTTQCTTIDHVFLDTGSIGLRVMRSAVAGLGLPAVTQPAGAVAECYPFVVGAVWGAMARADLRVAGELASNLPIQVIDDRETPQPAPPQDCVDGANGNLLTSITTLQAKAVLGVGMVRYDCGLMCETGQYDGAVALYYSCNAAGACQPTALPAEQQLQNPVSYFAVNNNGTLIVMPAVPEGGASLARGRLVFGIGTQSNNQLTPETRVLHVQTDPASPDYLYVATMMAGRRYDFSYVDSGSNGLFFDDPTLSSACVGSGGGSPWYCPSSVEQRLADIDDPFGASAPVSFSVASADRLFASSNPAFGNLAGQSGAANPGAFVWGMTFFYGRAVYTSIWGQALATDGPWYGF